MMTPRQDLLDHAVDLFPAPEGSVAEVQRDVARRHRNRRLGAAAVVIGIWVVIGVAASAFRPDDEVPVQTPTPTPSPTLAPGSKEQIHGWPTASRNRPGLYSWGSGCSGGSRTGCIIGLMHNHIGNGPAWGLMVVRIAGDAGVILPHEGAPVTVFGYEGSYLRYAGRPTGEPTTEGRASCERWMVDIQGTTVTIRICATPGAPADAIVEAHEIIESMDVEPLDTELGFRLVFTLTTDTWDSG